MKSFSFSLSSVLKYKNQVLNNLVIEYGEIANQVNKKREEISKIDEHLKSVDHLGRLLSQTDSAGRTTSLASGAATPHPPPLPG